MEINWPRLKKALVNSWSPYLRGHCDEACLELGLDPVPKQTILNALQRIGSTEEKIRVGKEEAETSALNQSYDKFQAKQDKDQTRQIMELSRQEFHVQILAGMFWMSVEIIMMSCYWFICP